MTHVLYFSLSKVFCYCYYCCCPAAKNTAIPINRDGVFFFKDQQIPTLRSIFGFGLVGTGGSWWRRRTEKGSFRIPRSYYDLTLGYGAERVNEADSALFSGEAVRVSNALVGNQGAGTICSYGEIDNGKGFF